MDDNGVPFRQRKWVYTSIYSSQVPMEECYEVKNM